MNKKNRRVCHKAVIKTEELKDHKRGNHTNASMATIIANLRSLEHATNCRTHKKTHKHHEIGYNDWSKLGE
jgi:hypothetical protein